jgi:hypothetical protein
MIPPRCEPQLISSANKVISAVCRQRMGAMKHSPGFEVDFVASLIENGVDMLEHEWKRVLAPVGIDVGVAGVFCHQSPKVAIHGTPPRRVKTLSCELADLLVLHSHSTAAHKVFHRATLVQAKMYAGSPVIPDEPQFWLYDNWPSFSIRAPGFDPRLRDFEDDDRSGRYGLVSKDHWKITMPRSPLIAHSRLSLDFGTFLVRMLYDMDPAQPRRTSSHGRQVYHNSSKDWSKTVWEIVEVTANLPLRHLGKKKGLYSVALPARMGGQILALLTERPKLYIIPPTPGEEVEGGARGISIFHIATSVQEG